MVQQDDSCQICGLNSYEAELKDAVIGREIGKVCTFCLQTTDVILIQRPTSEQLKNAEKPFSVFQRLRRASQMKMETEEMKARKMMRQREQQINLSKLSAKSQYSSGKNIPSDSMKSERSKPLSQPLVPNFSEIVRNARIAKGMNQQQLAHSLAESEQDIMFLEAGKIPATERLIKKIEQFLRIQIRADAQEPRTEKTFNFKSPTVTISDLRRMKEEMFHGSANKHADNPDDGIQEHASVDDSQS